MKLFLIPLIYIYVMSFSFLIFAFDLSTASYIIYFLFFIFANGALYVKLTKEDVEKNKKEKRFLEVLTNALSLMVISCLLFFIAKSTYSPIFIMLVVFAIIYIGILNIRSIIYKEKNAGFIWSIILMTASVCLFQNAFYAHISRFDHFGNQLITVVFSLYYYLFFFASILKNIEIKNKITVKKNDDDEIFLA